MVCLILVLILVFSNSKESEISYIVHEEVNDVEHL